MGALLGRLRGAPNGSGDFLSLAGTDGFVELAARAEYLPQRLRHHRVSLVS